MKSLRVATYNIHKCQGMDGRIRPERIARVLEDVNADVVALQEVVSIEGHRPEANQSRFLADALGMHVVQSEARKHNGGVYGNVLLSRQPVLDHRSHDITHGRYEARSVLRADLSVDGRDLHLFNLHLGTGFLERRQQARYLMEREILRAPDLYAPRIVLGDFNEWLRGMVTRTLSEELRRVDLEVPHFCRRYPALLPFMHLDYIYFESPLRPRDAFVYTSPVALVASDHLPVVADFSW